MVINAPIPRAINLGFLGPVPTRLIIYHLPEFPPALTAACRIRNVSGICLHYQPEDVAFIIDSRIGAIALRVGGTHWATKGNTSSLGREDFTCS